MIGSKGPVTFSGGTHLSHNQAGEILTTNGKRQQAQRSEAQVMFALRTAFSQYPEMKDFWKRVHQGKNKPPSHFRAPDLSEETTKALVEANIIYFYTPPGTEKRVMRVPTDVIQCMEKFDRDGRVLGEQIQAEADASKVTGKSTTPSLRKSGPPSGRCREDRVPRSYRDGFPTARADVLALGEPDHDDDDDVTAVMSKTEMEHHADKAAQPAPSAD